MNSAVAVERFDVGSALAHLGSHGYAVIPDVLSAPEVADVVERRWLAPWSLNVIWCLCDLRRENDATRFAPGSQRYQTAAELPGDLAEQMVPLEAPAGLIRTSVRTARRR